MSDYPGKGDCWADFLHHRARVLLEWEREGKSPQESAQTMSMDPVQVRMILDACRSSAEFDEDPGRPAKTGRGR